MLEIASKYLEHSSAITLLVLALLSLYFMLSLWIFTYKLLSLNDSIKKEFHSLSSLMKNNSKINPLSTLGTYIELKDSTSEMLDVYEISVIRDASSGLSWQSIIASTAPFIGLFGTVVGILESFSSFKNVDKVSFSLIAPLISEALVATAAGILVAILAYTFHQILNRKIYILNTYVKSQINIVLARS